MAELDDVKGCGLIHKKKQGQGKPAKIYVMKYTSVNDYDEPEDIEEIYDEASKIVEPETFKNIKIVNSKHGNDGGMIGAYYNFVMKNN